VFGPIRRENKSTGEVTYYFRVVAATDVTELAGVTL
jgi:hypothetical protein